MSLKITYCAKSKVPSREANSVHVMRICQALASLNTDVKLVIPKQESVVNNPYDFYGVQHNFDIKYIKMPRIRFGFYIYSYRVLQWLKRERNQFVYGRDFITCFFAAMAGLKTIWESHLPVDYMGRQYVLLYKLMNKKSNYLKTVVISSTLKQYYKDKFDLDDDKVVVLPDCSDIIDINMKTNVIKKDFNYVAHVGYIGQLYPGKGMEIISQLIPKCPSVFFHIIGGKDEDVLKWKKELSGCSNVFFHGFINPSDTVKYGLSMDILIAPYMRKVQGAGAVSFKKDLANWMSPLKIFEYMSYKRPIIVSDLPVIHDVLDETNSIMCDPDNIDQWVQAVNFLIINKEYARSISEKAYKDFLDNYTWSIRAKRIIDMFAN